MTRNNTTISKLYSVIYADPPWSYSFSATRSRMVDNQYPTMSVSDICRLKVPAAPNAVLYLWATAPKLREGIRVMDAWGFDYRTCAVWDKQIAGMGYWFRGRHELLLVGVKGHFSPPPPGLRRPSVYLEKRTKHSKKPDYIRSHIAGWVGDVPKLEMSAREKFPGWDVWGNQVVSDVEIECREDDDNPDPG